MRKRKYRAWNQTHSDWNKLHAKPIGEYEPLKEMYSWEDLQEYSIDILNGESEFTIMEYIGIKDKNGEEIYEDDILKTGYCIGVITWDFSGWYIKVSELQHHTLRTAIHTFEVIGNIYQNPELTNKEHGN